MEYKLIIKALKDEGFETHFDHPEHHLVVTRGVYNVPFTRGAIESAPVEWIIEQTKREITRLKEVAN